MPSRSSGRKSWLNSVETKTTSPGEKRPRLHPQATNAIPPPIIALVMSAWPTLSHASEFSDLVAARA